LLQRLRDAGKTIIVSSHILAELEDYSNWMLTLDRGKMKGLVPVHQDPAAGFRWLRIRVASDPAMARAIASAVDGVTAVAGEGQHLEVRWNREEEDQAELIQKLVLGGVRVVSVEATAARMQEVYLSQVGEASHES
jgi:ABC-2 type transport system ATP-binding protein